MAPRDERAPREYPVERRRPVLSGWWEPVVYARSAGEAGDYLADPSAFDLLGRAPRRLEHGELVRVVGPSGVVRDLRVFDARSGQLLKGDQHLPETWDDPNGNTLVMQRVLPQILRAGLGGGHFATSPFSASKAVDWRARKAVGAVAAGARVFARLAPDVDPRVSAALDAIEAWAAGDLPGGDPRLRAAIAGAAAEWDDLRDEGEQRADAMEWLGDEYEEPETATTPAAYQLSGVVYYLAGGRLREALQNLDAAVDRTYTEARDRNNLRVEVMRAIRTRFPVAAVLAAQRGLADPVPDRGALMPQADADRREPAPTLANGDPHMTFGEFVDRYGEAVTDLYQRRRATSPPMVWTVSYKYLTPSPAGPFQGTDRLAERPTVAKGDTIAAAFGKAYVTSVGRARATAADKVAEEDPYDMARAMWERYAQTGVLPQELTAPATPPPARQLTLLKATAVNGSTDYWRRLGEEDETDDWNAGNVGAVARPALASALWGHHEGDLSELPPDEQRAAWAAIVNGYEAQRASRRSLPNHAPSLDAGEPIASPGDSVVHPSRGDAGGETLRRGAYVRAASDTRHLGPGVVVYELAGGETLVYHHVVRIFERHAPGTLVRAFRPGWLADVAVDVRPRAEGGWQVVLFGREGEVARMNVRDRPESLSVADRFAVGSVADGARTARVLDQGLVLATYGDGGGPTEANGPRRAAAGQLALPSGATDPLSVPLPPLSAWSRVDRNVVSWVHPMLGWAFFLMPDRRPSYPLVFPSPERTDEPLPFVYTTRGGEVRRLTGLGPGFGYDAPDVRAAYDEIARWYASVRHAPLTAEELLARRAAPSPARELRVGSWVRLRAPSPAPARVGFVTGVSGGGVEVMLADVGERGWYLAGAAELAVWPASLPEVDFNVVERDWVATPGDAGWEILVLRHNDDGPGEALHRLPGPGAAPLNRGDALALADAMAQGARDAGAEGVGLFEDGHMLGWFDQQGRGR